MPEQNRMAERAGHAAIGYSVIRQSVQHWLANTATRIGVRLYIIAVGGNQVNGYHPVQRLAIFVKCPHVTDVSGLLILNREQATS